MVAGSVLPDNRDGGAGQRPAQPGAAIEGARYPAVLAVLVGR